MTMLTTDPDAPVRELLDRIAPHAELADPGLPALGEALMALAADHDYLVPIIGAMEPTHPVVSLHEPERGPRVFLAHREEGQMGAVHDHAVWVALTPVLGIETHRRWRPLTPEDRTRIEMAEDGALEPATYAAMRPPDDIHSHGHLMGRGDAAYVLIMLGDDQFAYRRREWDPATGRHRILEPGDRGRWLASEPWPV